MQTRNQLLARSYLARLWLGTYCTPCTLGEPCRCTLQAGDSDHQRALRMLKRQIWQPLIRSRACGTAAATQLRGSGLIQTKECSSEASLHLEPAVFDLIFGISL